MDSQIVDELGKEVYRLRAVNAKLLEALEKLTPIAFDAFEVWRDAFSVGLVDYFAAVEQAREAIEGARK